MLFHRHAAAVVNFSRAEVVNFSRVPKTVVLILCIAFVLSSAFALIHSKIMRLRPLSLLEVARQLYRSLLRTLPPIRAPA